MNDNTMMHQGLGIGFDGPNEEIFGDIKRENCFEISLLDDDIFSLSPFVYNW